MVRSSQINMDKKTAKELAKKKKVQAAHKGVATKLITKAKELLSQEQIDVKKEKPVLRQIAESAKAKVNTLRKLDDELIEISADAGVEGEDLETMINEGDELRAIMTLSVRSKNF